MKTTTRAYRGLSWAETDGAPAEHAAYVRDAAGEDVTATALDAAATEEE